MAKLYVVVDSLEDWEVYYPSHNILTVTDYLHLPVSQESESAQVINLCRSYKYQSKGYYCSLLAEARKHRVIPSVKAINDISKKSVYGLDLEDLENHVKSVNFSSTVEQIDMKIYFGKTQDVALQDLARKIFESFSFPIIKVRFVRGKTWQIESIKPVALSSLKNEEEDLFAKSLDEFSKKLWRKPRAKKRFQYDLAILCNEQEKLPPSNKTAIKNFIKAGKRLGFDVETIGKQDYVHLTEYDALFIRETTNVNNHTYRFAKKAESNGMIVMDDPTSILRCTNKVYLSNLLDVNEIRTPKTLILDKEDPNFIQKLEESLSYPVILKIPDGSFSIGIVKVDTREALIAETMRLFERTYLLIAQEYIYTDYDWRIGILNDRPLYACKYYMSKGHWQILNHANGKTKSGNVQALALQQVPKEVVKVAAKSAALIGDALYGVDIKMVNDHPVVIEINDNPNIDSNTEDQFLGDELYLRIMEEFLHRLRHRSF